MEGGSERGRQAGLRHIWRGRHREGEGGRKGGARMKGSTKEGRECLIVFVGQGQRYFV